MKHTYLLILLPTLVAFVMAGCSSPSTDAQLPGTNPDIKGIITRVDRTGESFHMMVEENPSDSVVSANPKGSAKSRVRVTERAQLLERSGDDLREITMDDLREGSTVSVWFDGPVLQSYPTQSGAKVVVLEGK